MSRIVIVTLTYLSILTTQEYRIMYSVKHMVLSFGKRSIQDHYHRSEGRNPAFRKERKRKAEMTFVWACYNRQQVRLEGKAWRIGSQAAIPRVSRGRIPCRGRNGAILASCSFNLELFSLFRFQFDSFIETSHSVWKEKKKPAFAYEAHKENRLRRGLMLLERTCNQCYDMGSVKRKWRDWILPYRLQVKRRKLGSTLWIRLHLKWILCIGSV
jgi:hypothetical protein